MSAWTHAQCEACWIRLHSEITDEGLSIREPTTVRDNTEKIVEACCFCGEPTIVGIYVRHDPKELPRCKGHYR